MMNFCVIVVITLIVSVFGNSVEIPLREFYLARDVDVQTASTLAFSNFPPDTVNGK